MMDRWDLAWTIAAGLVFTAVMAMCAGAVATLMMFIYALVCVQ